MLAEGGKVISDATMELGPSNYRPGIGGGVEFPLKSESPLIGRSLTSKF